MVRIIEEKAGKPTPDCLRPQKIHTISPAATPPRTPTALASSVHELFHEIRDICDSVSTLPSLAPGEQINQLLTRLVGLCVLPYSAEFIKCFFSISDVAGVCEQLRPICAVAEGELERYWARRIIAEAHASLHTLAIPQHRKTDPS